MLMTSISDGYDKLEMEIAELEERLVFYKLLLSAFCSKCKGEGSYWVRVEPDDDDEIECKECGGTGVRPKK